MTDTDWAEALDAGRQRLNPALVFTAAIGAAILGGLRAIERNAEHRRAIRDLQAMPDHTLKDMGVSRASIARRVRGWPED